MTENKKKDELEQSEDVDSCDVDSWQEKVNSGYCPNCFADIDTMCTTSESGEWFICLMCGCEF